MPDTSLSRNRHPVDQLADVRFQIKILQEHEADLKAQISTEMGSKDSLGGDEFIAIQTLQTRKGGFDEDKLADQLGRGNLDNFRKPSTTSHVLRVERRAAEVA